MISYIENYKGFKIKNRRRYTSWIKEVIFSYGYSNKSIGDISIVFCTDEYLLNINIEFLKHNYYTDIITFDYSTEKYISGDLLISIDTIKKNSQLYNQKFEDELHRVIIHGILHLLKFDDKNAEQKIIMRQQEERALLLRNF